MVELSDASRVIAGVLLLTMVGVEFGGTFMLRVLRGGVPATDLQKSFFRAGHAHAGVWVTLSLVIQVLADAADLTGVLGYVARIGVPLGAILLPGGFFLSVAGSGVTKPNGLFALVYAGAAAFAVGVVTLGIGLLLA
jgi:hypothetical protein